MIVNAELFVNDLPGQLIGSLEPISLVDGNILGVVHNRDKIIDHRICVNLTFEIDDRRLDELKDLWKSKDIVISSLGSVHETFAMQYILIGDVNAQYVEGLLKKINEATTLDEVNVSYSTKSVKNSTHTSLISVKARYENNLDKIDAILRKECKANNITYVRGV
ncbi:allosteric regulator of homoserine dehydrogenase [methanogenic archaeon mixed culture ISO4-G1]|nr:allosteric regulator of homoserine dehydrogenase [methanogenic archaeon mixed culture ISO4-G1]